MKKIYSLLGTVFMLCCLINVAFAQAPASATWSLVNPDNGGGGDVVATTGAITAAMTLQNMASGGYVSNSNPLMNTLRYRRLVGDEQFPANQSDIIPDTYIQFAVTPAEGQSFDLNTLSYDIGSQGSTSAFRTKVYYSTNAEFENPTQITAATGNDDDVVTRDDFKAISKELDVMVNSGETFYLRFYPWMHEASTPQTGKYIVLRNVTISGTTMEGTVEPTEPKKVAYMTLQKDMDPTAATVTDDPIIRMLKMDDNFEVTVHNIAANATVDLADYDVVVVQESFGSGSDILKPGGSLGLASISVPFIYNKTYALQAGRALADGQAGQATDATDIVALTVATSDQDNELFNGITFTENAVNIFKTTAADNGGEGAKAFSYNNAVELTGTGADNTLLASITGVSATGTPIFLNDIPAGTSVGGQTLQARMIAMGMNFGAITKDNGTNMTAEGLTLWRNSLYSLAGLEVPTTLVDPGTLTSSRKEIASATFSLGQNYPNPFHGSTTIQYEIKKSGFVALEVYDALGRKVATLANGNQAAGTYEVQLNKNLSNGMYLYKLSADGASITRRMLVTQ